MTWILHQKGVPLDENKIVIDTDDDGNLYLEWSSNREGGITKRLLQEDFDAIGGGGGGGGIPTHTGVVVSGAGSPEADGLYLYSGIADVGDSKPFWTLAGHTADPQAPLYYGIWHDVGNDYWSIADGSGVPFYVSSDVPSNPWNATWTVGGDGTGDSPAPTVLPEYLTLTGKPKGFQCYIAGGFKVELQVVGGESDAGNWYRVPVVQTAVLTADFPKTDDTLTPVTGWSRSIDLLVGHIYRITFSGLVHTTAGAAQFIINGGTCASTKVSGFSFGCDSNNSVVSSYPLTGLDSSFDTGGGTDGEDPISCTITIECESSGTFNIKFAQYFADEASILRKYATLTAEDITPT